MGRTGTAAGRLAVVGAGVAAVASVALAALLLRPAPPLRVEGPDLLAAAAPVTEAQARAAAAPVLPGAVLGASVRRGERGEIVVSDSPLDLGDGTRLRLTRAASAGIDLVREESGVPGAPPRRATVLLRYYPLPALPPDGRIAYVPRFLLSPDRAWLLRIDDGGGGRATATDRERVARCTAIPVRGGAAARDAAWTISLAPGDVLSGVAWRSDSRGWLAWRARIEPTAREERRAPSMPRSAAARYTLLTAQLGSPAVRAGLTVPEAGMFPSMLGTLPDGRTLAVESAHAKAPAAARVWPDGELATGPVTVLVDVRADTERFYDARDVVRILGDAAARARLVAFDGVDVERARTAFTLDVPRHASEAQLSLSPDGRRLAWLARVPPVDEAPLPIQKVLNRRAPNRRLRDGAAALYLADPATGGCRVVAVLPLAQAEDRAAFWWGQDSKSGYVSFWRPLAPGASAREHAFYRVPLP